MAKVKSKKGKFGQKPSRAGKRLGVKLYGGQNVKIGGIIIRQRGSETTCGEGTKMGKDFTIFAMRNGVVKFKKRLGKKIVCVQ